MYLCSELSHYFMALVTIIMPVYNAADTIRECIDSILVQSFFDFELLIADDGSTDSSCHILSEYRDCRIRLIRGEHNFINTLNILLSAAKGKYIARMDADDVMMPNRLLLQYDFMEAHPEVAALGGAIETYQNHKKLGVPQRVTAYELLEGCGIYNPTSMIRTEVVHRYKLKYEQEYIYAEDFQFWAKMAKYELPIHNLEDVLIRYRATSTQISNVHSREQQAATRKAQVDLMEWIKRKEEEEKRDYCTLPNSGNKLSVCISFLNEGKEVGRTVRSIRKTTGNNVDIVIINDASTDGYDYESDLKGLNVNYILNKRQNWFCCRKG